MRVELKTEGGLAYLPGLSQPVILDSDNLSKTEADALKRLIDAAHFFDLPSTLGTPPPGAADYRRYTLTIKQDGHHHSVQAVDPVQDAPLQALLDYIRETARKRQ